MVVMRGMNAKVVVVAMRGIGTNVVVVHVHVEAAAVVVVHEVPRHNDLDTVRCLQEPVVVEVAAGDGDDEMVVVEGEHSAKDEAVEVDHHDDDGDDEAVLVNVLPFDDANYHLGEQCILFQTVCEYEVRIELPNVEE